MQSRAADRSPASLFMNLYEQVKLWTASQRSAAIEPDTSFDDTCAQLLREPLAALAHDGVCALVAHGRFSEMKQRGRILAAMRALDLIFAEVHPRAVHLARHPLPLPSWLRDARANRTLTGSYVEAAGARLIPRGPLLRRPRHPAASSGEWLDDRFASLSVAPTTIDHDGRPIRIHMKVIGVDPFNGVPFGRDPGCEQVGIAPLACEAGELRATPAYLNGRMYADYAPAASFDAGEAAIAAIRTLGGVDVVVMPELAMRESDVDRLSVALRDLPMPRPRLIVAGSYVTSAQAEGQGWNECRVMNGRGVELWRQRKLWPAGVDQHRALAFGLPDPGPNVLVLENTASGAELVIADVEAFGRCVVLICQDIEAPMLANEVALKYQPDWVFVPILDMGFEPGRWTHARAFGLSHLSQARFVAVTSLAFAAAGPTGAAIAVGPKEPAPDVAAVDPARAFTLVERPPVGGACVALITWRAGSWEETKLSVARPR